MQGNQSEERGDEEGRLKRNDVLSLLASHEATSLYDDTEQLDVLQKVAGVLKINK